MKNSLLKKGFTLVELLVVVSIIGLLATIVVTNVNSAREKAKNAAIKGSMDSIRAAAELAYSDNGNYASTCTAAAPGVFGSTGSFAKISAAVTAQGGSIVCGGCSGNSCYAAASALAGGGYYCIDSTGYAKAYTTAIPAPFNVTACP